MAGLLRRIFSKLGNSSPTAVANSTRASPSSPEEPRDGVAGENRVAVGQAGTDAASGAGNRPTRTPGSERSCGERSASFRPSGERGLLLGPTMVASCSGERPFWQ